MPRVQVPWQRTNSGFRFSARAVCAERRQRGALSATKRLGPTLPATHLPRPGLPPGEQRLTARLSPLLPTGERRLAGQPCVLRAQSCHVIAPPPRPFSPGDTNHVSLCVSDLQTKIAGGTALGSPHPAGEPRLAARPRLLLPAGECRLAAQPRPIHGPRDKNRMCSSCASDFPTKRPGGTAPGAPRHPSAACPSSSNPETKELHTLCKPWSPDGRWADLWFVGKGHASLTCCNRLRHLFPGCHGATKQQHIRFGKK